MQSRVKTKIPSSKLHCYENLIGLRHKKRLGETKEGQLKSLCHATDEGTAAFSDNLRFKRLGLTGTASDRILPLVPRYRQSLILQVTGEVDTL